MRGPPIHSEAAGILDWQGSSRDVNQWPQWMLPLQVEAQSTIPQCDPSCTTAGPARNGLEQPGLQGRGPAGVPTPRKVLEAPGGSACPLPGCCRYR